MNNITTTEDTTSTKDMKVRVTITLTVNPDAWNDEYQTGDNRHEIRYDINEYVKHLIFTALGEDGTSDYSRGINGITIVTSSGKVER